MQKPTQAAGSSYLLYYRRLPDEQGQTPALKEVDDRTLDETFQKLRTIMKSPLFATNFPFQETADYSVFNLNLRHAPSEKFYTYYHKGKLFDDEYDEKKVFEKAYKVMLMVFRFADGQKIYVPLDTASEAYDLEKEFMKALKERQK